MSEPLSPETLGTFRRSSMSISRKHQNPAGDWKQKGILLLIRFCYRGLQTLEWSRGERLPLRWIMHIPLTFCHPLPVAHVMTYIALQCPETFEDATLARINRNELGKFVARTIVGIILCSLCHDISPHGGARPIRRVKQQSILFYMASLNWNSVLVALLRSIAPCAKVA
jgi:hypothetical protein